jgi:aspartate kinase
MRVVLKFGGTSLADGKRIRRVAGLVAKVAGGANEVVVVCSAVDDLTDELIALTQLAREGSEAAVEARLVTVRGLHLKALDEAVRSPEVRRKARRQLEETLNRLDKLARGSTVLREVTPRSRDSILSCGERLSSQIVAASLRDRGLKAVYMTGGDAGIMTDDAFGDAAPLMEVTAFQVRENVAPRLEAGEVPVVTGFLGVTQTGETTTIGRGGSDFTASLIAAAIGADEVWIWSDVDGLMTADPRIVKDARVLSEVSYSVAGEMAVFGAKALHPRTLEPVSQKRIPLRFKNTFRPDHPGTVVKENPRAYPGRVVKSVALLKDVAIITLTGASMVGKPGSAATIFDTVARSGTNVMMISQNVSESNISMVVARSAVLRTVNALELAMLGEAGLLRSVDYEDDVSAVAVIGDGMRGAKGISARVFGALARQGINVRMVAQGSSDQTFSFVVQERDGRAAVRTVHRAFSLDEMGGVRTGAGPATDKSPRPHPGAVGRHR